MLIRVLFRTFAVIAIICSLSACAINQGDIFRRELRDRGPIALSADNPYIAANRLLAREMESSETFRGFVKLRGTPDALEISKPFFNGYRFTFYYVEQEQSYILEQGSNDWLIQGPTRIDDSILTKLTGIAPNRGKAVLPAIRANTPPIEEQPAGQSSLKSLLDPDPIEKKEPDVVEPPAERSVPLRRSKSGIALPAPAPQPLEDRSQESSTESLSGDIIHTVKYQGETLRIISSWYTGDPESASRISRINGLRNADALKLDQVIRIPRYLVQQTKPLPEDEVSKYLKRLGK